MSWAAGHSPPPIQSNVPDYQKMLQSNLLSSGWSSRGNSDRYGHSYSHAKSPLSTSPKETYNGQSYSDTNHRSSYQAYRPSKYGLSSNAYDQSYLSKDFKELTLEETYNFPKYDTKDAYEPTNKYDPSSDLYPRSNKYSSYTSSRVSDLPLERPDLPLERPSVAEDSVWTSPPKNNIAELRSTAYSVPVRSSVDSVDFNKPQSDTKPANSLEDKYFSDNDIVTRGSKSRSRYGSENIKYSDLRQWQKGQVDHYDHSTPTSQGGPSEVNGGFNTLFKQLDENPRKWAPVSKAADDIIKEKDMMIEKLKMTIMRLEDDNKQYEGKLKRAVMNGEGGDGDTYKQIQDLEIKNAHLKAENADIRTKKNAELDELEMKLGATEQEVVQLRAALRKRVPRSEIAESQFYELEQEKEEWRRKYTEMYENHGQMKVKLDELQSYLSDLPTVEESMKNLQEIHKLREENKIQQNRIEEMQQKLYQSKKALSSREIQIQELEQKEKRLSQQVHAVTNEIDRLKSEGEGAELHRCEEELQRVKSENERLAVDFEKAKKLLETSHRKSRHLEVKHQNEAKQLQERLSHEEESVNALREDCRQKEENMKKLRKSMKELGSKNQDLMEQILIMREQLKHFEEQAADENQKLQRKFTQELSLCYAELQSLVQVCVQRAEGNDPNMSLLLGVRAPSELETGHATKEQEAYTLKQWLAKVKELRSEIEGLRGLICNKYAEDLGDNMNCNTQ